MLEPEIPPLTETPDGAIRRVGVEIEFAGVDCAATAALVEELFGGRALCRDAYQFTVCETRLGDFQIKLDMSLAHPEKRAEGRPPGFEDWLEEQLAEMIGDIGSLWMPVEVAAPPIAFDRLSELQPLVGGLRDRGAQGTARGLFYAFGTQLNPEIASREAGYLLRHLQAYLVLSDWLRDQINVDLKRRIAPFIDPFPRGYVRRVLDPGYAPSLARLIDDYLAVNTTRNRELDLLPLFAELDPARVAAGIPDPRIKARPTFHYRLPDSRIDDPDWSIVIEWNRWVRVERLAADRRRLAAACAAYLDHLSDPFSFGWGEKVMAWLPA